MTYSKAKENLINTKMMAKSKSYFSLRKRNYFNIQMIPMIKKVLGYSMKINKEILKIQGSYTIKLIQTKAAKR